MRGKNQMQGKKSNVLPYLIFLLYLKVSVIAPVRSFKFLTLLIP